MKRLVLAVVATALLSVSVPASAAAWRGLKWGSTPKQVSATVRDAKESEDPKEIEGLKPLLFVENVEVAGKPFGVTLWFHPTRGLRRITLAAEGAHFEPLNDALVKKYGASSDARGKHDQMAKDAQSKERRRVWISGDTSITLEENVLELLGKRLAMTSVNYEPRTSSDNL